MPMVDVLYISDPACPWSWAAEPALRRIHHEFGAEVRITYVMAGLARELDDGLHEVVEALAASAWGGMPVDPRGWTGAPPRSTYPACQAVKAAGAQNRDGAMLRVLREGFWLDREALDTLEGLVAAARRVPGLDVAAFERDLLAPRTAEAFAADLDTARGVPEERRTAGSPRRAPLPTFHVGADRWLSSKVGAEELSAAVADAGAKRRPLPEPEAVLATAVGRVALVEVAAACGLSRQRAAAELWRLTAEGRARSERVLGADVWRHAP